MEPPSQQQPPFATTTSPTSAPLAFGGAPQPASPSLFGASTTTFPALQQPIFGGAPQPTSSLPFGASTTTAPGLQQPIFGGAPQPTSPSPFSASTTTSPTMSTPLTFDGAPQPTSSSPFGSSTTTAPAETTTTPGAGFFFGSAPAIAPISPAAVPAVISNTPISRPGTFGAVAVREGTEGFSVPPYFERELGALGPTEWRYENLAMLPEFHGKCTEEVRFEDYRRHGGTRPDPPAQPAIQEPLFGRPPQVSASAFALATTTPTEPRRGLLGTPSSSNRRDPPGFFFGNPMPAPAAVPHSIFAPAPLFLPGWRGLPGSSYPDRTAAAAATSPQPFEVISREQITRGRNFLGQIEAAINASQSERIVELNCEYYKIIPHVFVQQPPGLIDDMAALEREQTFLRELEAQLPAPADWKTAAASFEATVRALQETHNQGPARCCEVWDIVLEAVEAEARIKAEAAEDPAIARATAEHEAEQKKVADIAEHVAALEKELAEQKRLLAETQANSERLKLKANEATQGNARAKEQLETVRRQHAAAQQRKKTFETILRKKDICKFTTVELVAELLREIGLGRYCAKFAEQGIRGEVLPTLSDAELEQQLGMGNIEDRKQLKHTIELINAGGIVRVSTEMIAAVDDIATREVLSISEWQIAEIEKWLCDRGVSEEQSAGIKVFCTTGVTLLHLAADDLKSVFPKLGDRKEFAQKITLLHQEYFEAVRAVAEKKPRSPSPVPSRQSPAPTSEGQVAETTKDQQQPQPPPVEYLCPITLEVMTEPVIARDGFSYERAAIERWFASHSTSPTTGAKLNDKELIPNHGLRSAILTWRDSHHF